MENCSADRPVCLVHGAKFYWDSYSCLFLKQLFRLLQPKPHYRIHKNEQDNEISTYGPYKFSAFGKVLVFIFCM